MASTDVLHVRYEIRQENKWLLIGKSYDRLKAWDKVATKSGLFRDPRCRQLLRAIMQSKEPLWLGRTRACTSM